MNHGTSAIQKALQSAHGAYLQRKGSRRGVRRFRGLNRLSVSPAEGGMLLHAELEHDVEKLIVLKGDTIVSTLPVRVTALEAPAPHYEVSCKLDFAQISDDWQTYQEELANVETTGEVSDTEVRSIEESDDPETLRSDAGSARLALISLTSVEQIPNGVAWIQIPGEDTLLRRSEFNELMKASDSQVPSQVLVYRIVARFEHTEWQHIPPFEHEGRSLAVYQNKDAALCLRFNAELAHPVVIRTDSLSISEGRLCIAGILRTSHDRLTDLSVVLEGRRSGNRFIQTGNLHISEEESARKFGRGLYKWHAALDFNSMDWSLIDNADNYDLYLEANIVGSDAPIRVRVMRTPYLVRATTASDYVVKGTKTLAITPYYTFKAKATSLILEVFDREAFGVLAGAPRGNFPQTGDKTSPVWIIGELSYKAQDNGLHLFRYLRSQRPDIDAYYVIDRNAPDLRNFDSTDHVVYHGSREHFELALRATRFVGTHHPDYLYPTRHPMFASRSRATRVFLQHGVMGTKWMVPNYGKNSPGFATDLFMVSSEREKKYIVSDFQYASRDVKVTGLPRFDALLNGDIKVNDRMLLVIPTWRDWLQTEDAFLQSDYLRQWREFLASEELADLVSEYDLDLVFSLHPNMQHFREHFADTPARLVVQGEVDVQNLIKTAAVMVTDYSSVGFDFSFLHKPVHYFQFDRERFLGKRGSHLDLDAELPGRIAFDAATLLKDLTATMRRGKVMEQQYVRRADVFMSYRDQNNSRRVVAEIEAAPLRERGERGWRSELPDKLQRRFRRHKYYYSCMRAMFRGLSALPAAEDVIVFESGLGKQYGDSPRYIYEELVRRGDTRTKVWIYSGAHRFTDPHTKAVQRLSPEYFWYLGKAKYWVSNQNMPHYLRRRRGGVFIQTWHGTPLKHMLLDQEVIHGRDEGYVNRVLRAAAQWSHLVSPSEYTTAAIRSSYNYQGPAIEVGYPRNDILLDAQSAQRAEQIRHSLGLEQEIRTVLYAPTFRDNAGNGKGRFSFELPMDLREFDRRFGQDTVLLLRMHVLVSNSIVIPEELRSRVIDVSGYPDIQELYLAADLLITDYSSVFFDYALLRRPIVFYAYDLENYRDNLRGFYLDYDKELPGPVTQTEDELWDTVERALGGQDIGGVDRQEFIERFAPHDDGLASQRVVDRFFGNH